MGNEKEMNKLIQDIYKPVMPSSEFKDRLLKHLASEISTKTEPLAVPLWRRPKVWITAATILAIAAIGYGVWLPHIAIR